MRTPSDRKLGNAQADVVHDDVDHDVERGVRVDLVQVQRHAEMYVHTCQHRHSRTGTGTAAQAQAQASTFWLSAGTRDAGPSPAPAFVDMARVCHEGGRRRNEDTTSCNGERETEAER